jgi:hypothetical protein
MHGVPLTSAPLLDHPVVQLWIPWKGKVLGRGRRVGRGQYDQTRERPSSDGRSRCFEADGRVAPARRGEWLRRMSGAMSECGTATKAFEQDERSSGVSRRVESGCQWGAVGSHLLSLAFGVVGMDLVSETKPTVTIPSRANWPTSNHVPHVVQHRCDGTQWHLWALAQVRRPTFHPAGSYADLPSPRLPRRSTLRS